MIVGNSIFIERQIHQVASPHKRGTLKIISAMIAAMLLTISVAACSENTEPGESSEMTRTTEILQSAATTKMLETVSTDPTYTFAYSSAGRPHRYCFFCRRLYSYAGLQI